MECCISDEKTPPPQLLKMDFPWMNPSVVATAWRLPKWSLPMRLLNTKLGSTLCVMSRWISKLREVA